MEYTNRIEQVVLVRHGKTDQHEALDPFTPINDEGRVQAELAGELLTPVWLKNASVFCSSHLRCRQTYDLMSAHPAYSGMSVTYDPLLREVDYGPGSNWHDIEYELKCNDRKKVGKFYYRFKHGESPADAYIRACLFWESAHRQAHRSGKSNVLVVSHGMMIRLLVMRWMHWTPEMYEEIINPKNCHPVVITRDDKSGQWKVDGLEFLSEMK